MALFRTLLSRHFHSLIKSQTSLCTSSHTHPNSHNSRKIFSFIHRTVTSSPQSESPVEPESGDKEKKRPLYVLFKEAVGLSETAENSENQIRKENNALKRKLSELLAEVKKLESNLKKEDAEKEVESLKTTHKSLSAMFKNQRDNAEKHEKVKREEPEILKELSPDMEIFVDHLYREGYFDNANFMPMDKFDLSCFDNSYGRNFIKFAALRFGKDHQEIARWISGENLKRIAAFGCPSLDKKCVFAAKSLRKLFKIQEATVCSKCMLKQSCKYVNQTVWKIESKTLSLNTVMRVMISYALDLMPPQLVVPDETKASVSRLLKEVVKLSKTT
ncbi:Zinc finger protein var3, chloroplastic [Quillaja saponaria]|uniref:Zinc finger protein var3, chloroplastic n=1 Tax=Quillaja saponaria TaxID=32244 RepID=A0AAD7KZH9_QUISA|nr:Zinc finger protein var3, chloroplastic [Quillaja saponaria]